MVRGSGGPECGVRCGVLVVRDAYGAGSWVGAPLMPASGRPAARVNPYQRAVFQAPGGPQGQERESRFRTITPLALISINAFSPEFEDMLGWPDRLMDAVPSFTLNLVYYQRVYEGGFQMERLSGYLYMTRNHSTDALIQLACRLGCGEQVTGDEAERALGASTDDWGCDRRALRKGAGYLLTAGELWRGEIDAERARRRIVVGVLERSLVSTPAAPAPAAM